jgi:hypothetical protein
LHDGNGDGKRKSEIRMTNDQVQGIKSE